MTFLWDDYRPILWIHSINGTAPDDRVVKKIKLNMEKSLV